MWFRDGFTHLGAGTASIRYVRNVLAMLAANLPAAGDDGVGRWVRDVRRK